MTALNYTVAFGVLGVAFYLTTLFVPNDFRPIKTQGQRLFLGLVLVVWYGLTPLMYWRDLASMPQWAVACFLIGTGFGLSAGLLVMRARKRVVS